MSVKIREKVKAAVFLRPDKFEIQEFEKPLLGDFDILMKAKLCGVCGADIHFWNGASAIPTPCIMGHEFIGEVAEAGRRVLQQRNLTIGDQIAVEILIPCHRCEWCKQGKYGLCQQDYFRSPNESGREYGCNIPLSHPPTPLWGGFAQYLYVPQEALVHKYKKRVEWKKAVLTEPLATALHAIDLARLRTGESCVVLGPGPIGLCVVIAAKNAGAYPIILIGVGEKDENRLAVGEELGADYTINLFQINNSIDKVREITEGFGTSVSIEASGSPEAQLLAIKMVKRGGRCIFIGESGEKILTIVPNNDLVFREVSISGSFLSTQGYEGALKIIQFARFSLSRLVTHEFSLKEINEAFHFVKERRDNVIKAVINPWL